MKQTWDKFGEKMHAFKAELETLIEMLPISEKIRKQQNRLNKSYNYVKQAANEMDQFVAPVKSIEVASPLLNDAEFKATWTFWKDYLNEQHGIVMRSRAELMALKRIMDISGEKTATAIAYLEFAMSRMDRNFYRVNEQDVPASKTAKTANMGIVLPEGFSNPMHPATTPTEKTEPKKAVFHQKTIQEEIENFKKSKRKKPYKK